MGCLYETRERDGVCLDALSDETLGIRVECNRRGAEPISLARRGLEGDWTGFLYRDGTAAPPAEGWKNHSTVMGYYVHRLKDGHTVYRGQTIRGGTHSFLRNKDFAAPVFNAAEASLTYTLDPGQIAPEEYPGQVRLELTYALRLWRETAALQVTFRFTNLDQTAPAHVSFGLHPGFAVTSLEEARVILPAGRYLRHLAPGDLLSGETVEIEHAGGPMPFPKAELPGSFLLELLAVPEPVFAVEDAASGRRVSLDYHEAPYVTLWSNGDAFVCVEPCWGLPDAHEQRPFEQKLGIQEIEKGGTLSRSFFMAPELVEP